MGEATLALDVGWVEDALDRWASERLDPARIDQEHRIDPELVGELADLGAFGASISCEHGGLGLGLPGACAVAGALAVHDRSVATTVGLHLGLGSRALTGSASAEQRGAWLPAMAAGQAIGAFCATEPGAGSDLAAITTRAVPSRHGYRLDGSKVFVTNGALASVFTVVAVLHDEHGRPLGPALFLIRRDDAGVAIGAEERKLGLRGSSTTSLHLDAVQLDRDRLVVGGRDGTRALDDVLAWGRTAMAAGCVGTARSAQRRAQDHTTQRRQFRRRLRDLEVVAGQLQDIDAMVFAMHALVQRACHAPAHALVALSSSAKVFCSEGAWRVCDSALQLFGGSGYIEETGMPLLLRDARITRIFEGANDVLLVHIGTRELVEPAGAGSHPLSQAVAQHVAACRAGQGMALMRDQAALHRLGRLVVLRDATEAVQSRAATAPEQAERWTQLASWLARPLLGQPVGRAPSWTGGLA